MKSVSLTEAARRTGFYIPPLTEETSTTSGRISGVRVSRRVYGSYVFLYDEATRLVTQMDAVRNDRHHQEILLRGPVMGYRMPSVERIRHQTDRLRETLNAFDPEHAWNISRAQVMIPASTAQGFYMTAVRAALLIDDMFENVRNSEYMLWIRALKVTGEEYTGPTSLQEAMNMYGVLLESSCRQLTTRSRERLPANWLDRLSL